MAGSVACACVNPETGRRYGRSCPKKKHAVWMFTVDLPTKDGKRRQARRSGFVTKRQAADEMAKLVAKVASGQWRDDENQTIEQYVTRWIERRENANSLRPSTLFNYKRYIEQDIIPALGHIRIGKLRVGDVDEFIIDLRNNGRGAPTIKRIIAVLRSALSDAKRRRLIEYNPAEDAEMPSAPRPYVHPWEAEELGQFLDHSANHRLGALFIVLAYEGLRRGEVCGLKWNDIDLRRGILTVRRQLAVVNGKVVKGAPKTQQGDRRVEISDATVQALLTHHVAQQIEQHEWSDAWSGTGRVFTREDGSDLNPENVSKLFRKLTKEAGLRPVRLHDLRHGAASLLLASGADISLVSKRLGHSSISITSDTYTHLIGGAGQRATNAAAALVPRKTFRDMHVTEPESIRPVKPLKTGKPAGHGGAARGNRTRDLLITSQPDSEPNYDEQ